MPTAIETVKHTPGPWNVSDPRMPSTVVYSERGRIARCDGSSSDVRADAHLIAAAPELLAALSDLAEQLWHEGPRDGSEQAWQRIKTNAMAAIRKARGE